jgi:succinate-semialdehyde dehydrogenase/glutarate-semialdehyde dehydrogenase
MASELRKSSCFINGRWVDSADGKRFDVINPATGDQIGSVPDCSEEDACCAIESAHQALPSWRSQSAKVRSKILRRWYELIEEHREALARLMTEECGKPLHESLGEVDYGAAYVEWYAEEAKRAYGEITPSPVASRRLLTIKQAVGVCAAITPWNFPLAMITRKCAPALAAGCTMILKPAEASPLTALALAYLADQAGLPPGVFNVVTASNGAVVGGLLASHPLISKLTFTGSTAVGKLLLKQGADTVKRMSMELGGNAPFIVFDDADLTQAVDGAMASKYRNSGQTCVCTNRFIVHASIAREFADKLALRSKALTLGNGLDLGVNQGPLINQKAVEKVTSMVADAIAQGAQVICGGKASALGGNFFEPTVVLGVTQTMRLANEEIFGPISPVMVFHQEAEAIALANATPYGLAAYFYSRDLGRIWRVAEALECGMVGINEGIISSEQMPFGGIKESGIGREGGHHGLDEYLELKYLCLGGLGSE